MLNRGIIASIESSITLNSLFFSENMFGRFLAFTIYELAENEIFMVYQSYSIHIRLKFPSNLNLDSNANIVKTIKRRPAQAKTTKHANNQ